MKGKVIVIEDKVRLPENVEIIEIPELQDVLHEIWMHALKEDYKVMSEENLIKKYNLKSGDLVVLELLMDENKKKEQKKLLEDKRPIYID